MKTVLVTGPDAVKSIAAEFRFTTSGIDSSLQEKTSVNAVTANAIFLIRLFITH